MKRSILNCILISLILFPNCTTKHGVIAYYKNNIHDIKKVAELSETLVKKYTFATTAMRYPGADDEIRVAIHDSNAFKGSGIYLDKKTLQPTPFSLAYKGTCDSCSVAENEMYSAMLKDTVLMQIVKLFVKLDPQAIKISPDGVFIALGFPLERANKTELSGGVFLSFDSSFNHAMVVGHVEGNVYLYDDTVE